MPYYPVGKFHDGTSRLIKLNESAIDGFITEEEAQRVIGALLEKQSKPHHVDYEVQFYTSLKALQATGVLI